MAHWPGGIPKKLNGGLISEVGHVIDLLPTFLDLAGIPYGRPDDDRALTPVAGTSLVPALNGASLGERTLYFEHQGNAAVRVGPWKLVRAHRQPWELYDLQSDRTELDDLSKRQPERVAELKAKWQSWADTVGVQPWPIRQGTK